MNLYDKVLEDLLKKKQAKEEGYHNMIPCPFERYSEYFPGIIPGDYIGILGMTGSAKSRLVRYWMYKMVDFAMATGYPLKIANFALEDPVIPVGKKILTHYLYDRHGISVSPKILNSRVKPLDDSIINAIKKDERFWKDFYNYVAIFNNISNPDAINTTVQKIYEKYGKTHHIITIVDNQSNLTPGANDENEWAAIKRFSRNIVREKWCEQGITTITVLQTDFETERNTFRNAGKGSLVNIEPNLASIGDAKVVARSMHYIFGLFDPWRFEIKEYPFAGDYNIEILRGRFRSLIHLKSNEEAMAPRLGLYFDGLHEIFTEMPRIDEKDKLNQLYIELQQQQINRLQKLF